MFGGHVPLSVGHPAQVGALALVPAGRPVRAVRVSSLAQAQQQLQPDSCQAQ